MKFNIVSLFSGCGGLDKGFEMAGPFEVIYANDVYIPSCKTFSKNFKLPLVRNPLSAGMFCGDVENAGFLTALSGKDVDVVTGGPPCQDFSVIRGSEKRKGIFVKRGRLYVHFVRALVELQPKMFVFENVKGLISANGGLAFNQIIEDFRNLNLRWQDMWENHKEFINFVRKINNLKSYEILFSNVVDFSKLGVPQQRERVIVIGIRKDFTNEIDLRAVREKIGTALIGGDDLIASFPLTPIEVFEGKPLIELEEKYRKIMMEFKDIQKYIQSVRCSQYFSSVWSRYNFDIWHDYLIANGLPTRIDEKIKEEVMKRHEEILREMGYYNRSLCTQDFKDGSNKILPEREHVKARMSFIPPGENHEFVRGTEYEVVGLMSNIYRRIHPLKPSPTIIARGGGGTWGYHYERHRQRLTNRERACLQTFPDDFYFEGGSAQVRRQIGEAVPPLASKRIAQAILPILEKIS